MVGLKCIYQPERMKWIKHSFSNIQEVRKRMTKSTVGKCGKEITKIRMEINKLKYRKTVELINQRAGSRGKIPNNIIY